MTDHEDDPMIEKILLSHGHEPLVMAAYILRDGMAHLMVAVKMASDVLAEAIRETRPK